MRACFLSRDAVDTIRGYYYQFDYSILQILRANEGTTITLEGIEDVDVSDIDEQTLVQCKYYAGTDYNHSVIGKPIRLMLKHFSENKESALNYHIYGFYSKGQEKLPNVVNVEFAKKHFFTYTNKGTQYELHNILNLTDDDIEFFLSRLVIDINAHSYEHQNEMILSELRAYFRCSLEETEHYYNNALGVIKNLVTQKSKENRSISKNEFLNQINNKNELFNLWYLNIRGLEEYCKRIRKMYFTVYNLSPFSRFFLIQCDQSTDLIELKTSLINISRKMSKLSSRAQIPFCPYVYIHDISEEKLVKIKHELREDRFKFIDGHDFKDATFDSNSIVVTPNHLNGIKLKIVNNLENLSEVINTLNNTREIYQFYIDTPFYENNDHRHVVLPITSIKDIDNIL